MRFIIGFVLGVAVGMGLCCFSVFAVAAMGASAVPWSLIPLLGDLAPFLEPLLEEILREIEQPQPQ